ncbi:hypothetical protein RB653_008542 [Dictyostelium firmibasis]|uniref:Uncharacterized protein n=1 Tax=Dictyostelium firmibasis TaxID=79012 RepID=A0AAN7TR85_9MYCE
MNVQNIFYIFLFFIFFCGSFCENIYDQTQIEWENYYSTIISNYIYSSFRYPTELNFPSFTINKKSQPCELFTFSNNNPSINKLFFNMENINNSSYRFNENLKCYTDNNNLEDCKINLPISRCIDNDSPNLSDIKTILSFIDKGFNLKNSLKSYFSSKQSYFYYVSSFLNNYKSVDQYNRSNSYWNEMIEQLEFVINNFINLSQSPIPKDIQSILSPINPLILSDSLKSKIIDQTSFTINKLLNSLNSLLNVLQSLPNYSPYSSSSSSSSSSFTSSSQLSINSTLTNILNDLKQLNDFQISNLNIFFGLTNQFEIEIPNLFEPGQTLLEYYLEFTTSSTLIESLVNELLLLNNLSNSKLKTITQEYQNLNFNKLKSIESNLLIISNLIKSSSNLISSSNQTSLTSLNYFNCDFNIINSIYKSFNQIISPPFYSSSSFSTSYNYDLSKKITFEDIGYCRDLVKKIKSTTLELTILNQLTGTGQLIGIGNGGTDILMYDFGNRDNVKFITSSLFSNVVKSSDSLLFQKDGYVLNLIYPKSTNKPIIYPPPIIVPPTVGTSSPTSCPYPTCKLKSQSGCLSDVPSNFYYNIDGVCDLCQGIPENSVNSYLLSNGKIGTSSICPYLCALPKQYKLGVWNDYNFQPCIETPIGYYSNLMNNSITECSLPTSPSIFTIDPNRLWFGSNAATDSCLVTPKYQLIFINSDYNLPRNILPTEVLNRGTTIEMWLKIDSTNLPKVDSIVGITGIYQSWELSFIYITLNKTITPAITNPVNQQIIFQDSTVSSIILPNSFFHFAVIVETNNIIGFYINGERVGRTIFTVTAFNGKTNYQYIGGSQFNRLSFIIDEFKTYNRALSPNELGYKNTNQMIISSCNPQNGEILCDGNCVSSCLDSLGLYLNSTDCTCHCKDSSKEIIVNGGGLTYCLPKCPINSYRNLNDPLQCDCVDGEFKVLKTKQVKISSIYQYDKIDNYYSNNIDKKVGLLSVRIFNERGELVKPISCSSSSNDGSGNTCNNLFDENANSYWCTSGQTGFGYVLLNLPTITTIARISITPLPNPTTMKEISISISTETSSFINYEVVVIKSTLPLQVNQVDIDYETVSSKNVTSFTCIACPTIPTFKESQSSPKYIYPPISSLPRNEMKSCGCFGRFSFDQSSFSCMPPLPSPTFTLPSGSYKTETIVNIVYDIQVTTGYRLLYTIDSSDPVETSTDFPINQGITFKDIDRVELKVRSFKSGRLASDVSSGIYKIQGVIDCTLTPSPTLNNSVEPFIFDEKVNVLINCKTIPAINSISSSWIYYSTDLIDPPTNKYNPKYGVNLIAEPTIGTNTITLKVLSKLDQYFSFTGDFLFKIQPTIPPPIISPPDQINFTNSVPIKILIPSIEDTTSTSITTITYYKNYSIYYDLIDQGISNPPPLNSSKGKEYFQNDYLIIQCTTPESGCLLHLRAIGCINQACSRITQKYFKLTFDFDQLLPTIKSKYQKDSNSYLITIQSNSLLVGIKTLYQYTLIKSSSDLSICQSTLDIQVSNSLEYVNPFNISSVEKGYYCICLKNFKNFYNKLLNSKQLCRILVYTYQMDSPIFLQYGEYISNSLEFGIYPNTKNFQHNGEFKVEVGNGDATEDSQSLNGTNLILKLSPSLSYQKFSISAIDCPKDFICSEPSNSEIILRDKCSDPYVSKPSGIYYNNITIYGNCDNGCLAVVEFINSSNQNDPALIPTPQSQLFPSSLFLSSPNSDETVTIFLMMCVNSFKANSNTLDFIYTIEKYLRPSKPIINPGQGGYLDRSKNQFITMACSTLYPNETCSIFFSIRYSNSKSNVPLLIDAIKQPIGSNYDYQYVGKFVPNYVGTFYIVAIATVEKSTQSYDYLYSTESMVSITVYGDRPKIEMVPLVTSFYPSASISLISTSTTDINDLIFIYVSIFNDTYYKTIPPLYNFKNYDSTVDDSLTISVNTTIYAYIQGKYYNLIDNSSIQSFSLYYNKQKDEEVYPSSNENDKADGNTKISPLIFLLLLFIPLIIGILVYKFIIYKYYLKIKYIKLIEMSIKTGLKTD